MKDFPEFMRNPANKKGPLLVESPSRVPGPSMHLEANGLVVSIQDKKGVTRLYCRLSALDSPEFSSMFIARINIPKWLFGLVLLGGCFFYQRPLQYRKRTYQMWCKPRWLFFYCYSISS